MGILGELKEVLNGIDEKKSKFKNFLFVVDMDERGVFSAHVEDPKGKEVFSFSSEDEEDGELWIVRDGFMRHSTDIAGLEEYLVDLKIIPRGAVIYNGESTRGRDQFDQAVEEED